MCALCGEIMSTTITSTNKTYKCINPHYTVISDSQSEVAYMVVLPYSIDTCLKTNKSRIYKLINGKLRFLLTTPIIKPDTEEKILNRIKKLLIFL